MPNEGISHTSVSLPSMPHSTSMPHRHENMQYNQNVHFWSQDGNNLTPHPHSRTYTNIENRVPQHLAPDNMKTVSDHLKSLDEKMQQVLTAVKNVLSSKRRKRPVRKPTVLPIISMEHMEAFEHVEEAVYLLVVHYFEFLGGFHIKEMINMCLKEAVHDTLTSYFTWWGTANKKSFSETRLVRAIFDAACNNANFKPPTRLEFQKNMKEALRTAKERNRSRNRKRQQTSARDQNRAYWNDNGSNTNDTENTDPTTDE